MNIFLLDADEWRHDILGLAGNPIVKTPSLDALAGEGGRFTESCVTTAICGVSRVNLYTGKWMSGHGCRGFKMFDMPMSQTYSSLFRKEDYFVEHVGSGTMARSQQRSPTIVAYTSVGTCHKVDGKRVHVTQRSEMDSLQFSEEWPKDRRFCLTGAFFAPHAEDSHKDQFLPQPASGRPALSRNHSGIPLF